MATLYNSKHRSWTTLNNGGSLSSGGTSVTVLSAASLPAAPFVATIEPGVTGQEEVVAVTGVASNTLTLVRGLDGTTGVSHPDGCLIKNLSSSLAWSDMISLFANHKHTGSDSTLVLPNYYAPNAYPNGGFEVWQRGTSFAAITDGTYFADRWVWNQSGTGVLTVAQDTSVPAISANAISTPWSAKATVTTADTSIAAGDLYAFYSVIEGYDYRALSNGFSASWWAKAHRTGTYCVSFYNKAFNRSYIVEYTIAVADTWQYFTAVVPAPTGVWTLDNQRGMYCEFSIAAGTTWTTGATANTWLSSGLLATSNQINGVAATTDTFSLWGLNVVPGTIPQPYQPMPYELGLDRCQRYYEVQGTVYDYGYHDAGMLNIHWHGWHTKKGGTPTVTLNATLQLGTATIGLQNAQIDGYNVSITSATTQHYGFTYNPTGEWNPA